MKPLVIRTLLTVAAVTVTMALAPSTEGGMLGSRVQLETFYPDFDMQTSTRPIKTVSMTEVELADVAQYQADSLPGHRLVNVDIDLLDSSITISFAGLSGSFAGGPVNTYVFTDVDDTMPDFTGFEIDTAVTTLGIEPSAVTFTKDQLFINVSGLSFNSSTFAQFDISFGPQTTRLLNISTRLRVETGNNVLIGGFIVDGNDAKTVMVRAIGPSLPLAGALADPILELYDLSGALMASNDNWKSNSNKQAIIDSGIPPSKDKESAILTALEPGAYTAIVRGVNETSGVSLVEVYDLDDSGGPKLANISTRGLVQTGDDVLIGGFIVTGDINTRIMVRAIGPSLPLTGTLQDPTLELYDVNATLIATNDDWRSDQEEDILASTIAPADDAESAIIAALPAGAYTAIVRGSNGTVGIALVEGYHLNE